MIKSHTPVTLRAVRPSDAEGLCEMANLPGYRRGTMRMPFEAVEFWSKRIAASPAENTWIVAEAEGRIAGTGQLMPRMMARTTHAGDVVLGVRDDCTGRGVGSAILAALLDVADNWRGLTRLQLSVFADNTAAIRLYEKHGFQIEGRAVTAALVDGVYTDALWMARLVS